MLIHRMKLISSLQWGLVLCFLILEKNGGLPHEMGEWGQKSILQNPKITHTGLQLCNNG